MSANPIREQLDRAVEMDRRRQKQIQNQIDVINRLLEGVSYDDVFRETVEKLSEAQARIEEIENNESSKPDIG